MTNRMTIQSDGNVGIGTTSPDSLLNLYKNTTNGATMKFTSSGGYSTSIGQKSSSTADRSMQFTSDGYAGANAAFKFLTAGASSGYTEALAITGDGNVGIGETAPSARLQVKASGTGNPSVNGLYVYNPTSGSGDAIITARVLGTGGDPYISLDVHGVSGWAFGMDSSDSGKLKWGSNWDSLTTGTKMTLDRSGNLSVSGRLRINNLPIASLSDSRSTTLTNVDLTSANFYDKTWLNNGSHFDASTGRFTCPGPGIYRIYFRVTATLGTNVRLRKNGSGINEAYAGADSTQRSVSSEAVIECVENDYLHIQVSSLTPQGGTQHCQVTFQQLG
jgi:hypothetical protein